VLQEVRQIQWGWAQSQVIQMQKDLQTSLLRLRKMAPEHGLLTFTDSE